MGTRLACVFARTDSTPVTNHNAGDQPLFCSFIYHTMSHSFRLNPLGLAVCGALALLANAAQAQVFDVNSPAVREAYVGAATQEKKDSALAGLRGLANEVRRAVTDRGANTSPGFGSTTGASGYLIIAGDVNDAFKLRQIGGTNPPFSSTVNGTAPSFSLIQAANDNDLGAPGAAVTLNNSRLEALASFNTARNFTIGEFSGVIDTKGFNLGISGTITATGHITKIGAGTLSLTGNNVWNNAPIVNFQGTIEGNTNSLQTSIVNQGTVRFNQSQDGIYSGVISDYGGSVEKTGPGKLTLTAAQTYTYGTTSILGGTLALADNGALPVAYATALYVGSGTTLDISASTVIVHNIGALSGSGNIILGGNSLNSGSFLSANAFSDTTFSGSISGLGGFTKAGGGTLTLTGVNNYIGNTNIFDSRLSLAGVGRINRSNVVQLSRGTLDISGANGDREVGSIGGNGNVTLGANTLIVGNANIDNQFEGSISGSGGLTKTGTGTLTLIGTNNFTGITTISQGTLAAHARSISDQVVNNGTLTFVSLSTDGFSLAYGGSISGTGNVNSPFGTLTLTGVNTYTGKTTINGGWLALAGQGRLNSTNDLNVASGTFDISGADGDRELGSISGSGNLVLGNNTLTVGSTNTDQQFSGQIQGSGGLTKTGGGSLTLSGFNTFTGTTTINQGKLIAGADSISDRVVNNASLTLTERIDTLKPFVSTYSGNISGTGQVIKDGDGIIWLRGRNSYSGGTEVKKGILIGNTDSLQGNITNNSALAFYQVDNGTYAGNLSGSGTLLQYGPGVLTLTGNNTYTGGTAFSGTLRVDRDANLGAASGALLMAGGTLQIGADMTTSRTIILAPDGGTIDTNGYKLSTDVVGRISGPGTLTKIGAGTLSLNGTDDPFAVVVKAGRLEVNNVLNTNNVAVAASAELGGSGYIFGNVSNSGRLARGGGIGAINVEGHVTFEPGSVFSVRADAAGNSDRLVLTQYCSLSEFGL